MKELALKYGCNPNQKPARIFMTEGELPIEVLNGKPGYINFCDAFNSWQLVRALKKATGMPAAASFKHVSPAGAALGKPLTDIEKQMYFVDTDKELSPIACAYIRARGADRLCSYGDWAALSDTCDADTASYLAHEVSDGIIAPDFTAEALEILKTKRKGGYNVVKIDPDYEPKPIEQRDIFGIRFEQGYNNYEISESLLNNIVTENKDLPESAKHDMILALITLKYTQSNSVCYVKDGMTIGVGAGQQSRIHCTRLADNWFIRQHPKVLGLQFVDGIRRPDRDNAIDVYTSDEYEDVLAEGVWQKTFKVKPEVLTAEEKKAWIAKNTGVTVGSDAFFPFGDNVERARKSGVQYIVQPGGSIRDDNVIETVRHHDGVHRYAPVPSLMKLLKGYYAYLAVAGGFLLSFAAKDNWALQMLAYGLISAGALSLQGVSRWYMRASVAADVKMVFSLVLGPAVIPVGLLRIALYYIGLVPLLLTGCMLLLGVKEQMQKIEHSTLPEWALLAVWSAGYILVLVSAPGWLNDYLFNTVWTLANSLISIGGVALIVEMFRAQRIYLQTEEQ